MSSGMRSEAQVLDGWQRLRLARAPGNVARRIR